MKLRLIAALAAFAAPFAALADGFADEFISTDDETVRALTVGTRRVYVFTNESATVSVLQPMTLREALLVGGGGAGGSTVGGGGGGGGVVALSTPMAVFADDAIAVAVGAGGVPVAAGAWGQAGSGGASSLTVPGALVATAFGGGGGGGYSCTSFASGSWGSSGGVGACGSVSLVDGLHYTSSQGNPGAKAMSSYNLAGGGGGAGSAATTQNGGEGVTNAITGTDEVYGSGGGGATRLSSGVSGSGGTNAGDGGTTGEGYPGVDGFGGGGGGGIFDNVNYSGGRGGCGTVILSFEEGAEIGQPEISSATITFPYGTSQPQVDLTVGGAGDDDVFSATVTVKVGSSDGAADYCEKTFSGVANGDALSVVVPASPAKGTTVFLTVTVSARSAETRTRQLSANVVDDPSPYAGRGGGSGVVHVRPGATGLGDGSDWFNACTSLRDAIELLSAERTELWFAGDEVGQVARPSVAPAAAAAIRGGFDGLETSPEEREPGAKSVCDAQGFNSCFAFANAVAVTLDGFELVGGKAHNLEKSGAGDLTVTNCVIRDTSGAGNGRGVYVTSASAATVRLVDVRFSNLFGGGAAGDNSGTALFAKNCGRVEVDWCAFTTNGCQFAIGADNKMYQQNGAALYAESAPLTVTRTLFAGNRSQALQGGGGVVRVKGACGESAFTNCLFVGNEVVHGFGNYTQFSSPTAGMVAASPSAGSVDLVNCTFAYGTAGVSEGAAGVSVYGGTAKVLNCIFYGNAVGAQNTAATDVYVAGGEAEVSYCLFDDDGDGRVAVSEGVTASVLSDTFVYGDPLFATEVEAGSWQLASSQGTGWLRLDSAKLGEICAFDAHLRGGAGYLDERTGEVVRWRRVHSPAIDAGDPKSSWAQEAQPNGRRVNLGCYGNTPWATRTPGGAVLIVR